MRMDLNSDVGESFGALKVGDDARIIPLLSSANVACGFHGGDPRTILAALELCAAHGVRVGAHPGFPDLVGFGRRQLQLTAAEVRTDVLYQVGALKGLARAAGVEVEYVKPHGALYNQAGRDEVVAGAIATAVAEFGGELAVLCRPGSALAAAAAAAGLRVTAEGFADRAYQADGSLAPRDLAGAVISDPAAAAAQALQLAQAGRVGVLGGGEVLVPVTSVCVHSDTAGAFEILVAIRAAWAAAGIEVGA